MGTRQIGPLGLGIQYVRVPGEISSAISSLISYQVEASEYGVNLI